MLEIVLDLFYDYAVDDVEMVIATAFHRPMSDKEIKHIVGSKIFNKYWPDRLYNHDAEFGGTFLGTTKEGYEVEINAKCQSDLLIYLDWLRSNERRIKSVGTGLTGYRTLKHHHNPDPSAKAKLCGSQPHRQTLKRVVYPHGVHRSVYQRTDRRLSHKRVQSTIRCSTITGFSVKKDT